MAGAGVGVVDGAGAAGAVGDGLDFGVGARGPERCERVGETCPFLASLEAIVVLLTLLGIGATFVGLGGWCA